MQDEHRGMALVVMGITAIVGVIGLVLMFSGGEKSSGALFTTATDGKEVCPMPTKVGEPQWFPVLAGPKEDARFLQQWQNAGYECVPSSANKGIDEYSYKTWCCRNPVVQKDPVNPQVLPRGPTPVETRQGFGQQVGQTYPAEAEKEYPAAPRLGP